MALNDLTPVTRMESILNGNDIEPVTREEYFIRKAASGGGMYFVHVDGETMSIVEDYTEVSNAVGKIPVYLVTPDGNELIPISTNGGTVLIGYAFEIVGVLGASNKLGITKIKISNTGSVSFERFSVDVATIE